MENLTIELTEATNGYGYTNAPTTTTSDAELIQLIADLINSTLTTNNK